MFDYDADKGRIRMYGVVGDFGDFDETDVMRALDAMEGRDVTMILKSPGGEVDSGLSIFNQIERYPGRVTVEIDTQASSIASVFPLAANEVIISRRAEMLVHDPWTIAAGDAATFAEIAEWLDGLAVDIASIYAEGTRTHTAEDWREIMRESRTFNSEAALAAGLVNSIAAPPGETIDDDAIAAEIRPAVARSNRVEERVAAARATRAAAARPPVCVGGNELQRAAARVDRAMRIRQSRLRR